MSVAASTGCVRRATVLLVQGAANARASADLPLPVVAIGESATTAVLNTLHTLLTEGGDLTLRSVSTYSHQPLDVVAAVVTALGSVLEHTATTEFEPFRASLAPTPQTGQPFDVIPLPRDHHKAQQPVRHPKNSRRVPSAAAGARVVWHWGC
jgi:hypothetical protein